MSMYIDDLIANLQKIREGYGNLPILQQADSEGNSCDWSRGAEIGIVTDDLDCCYSTMDDVEDDGRSGDEVSFCVVIYP